MRKEKIIGIFLCLVIFGSGFWLGKAVGINLVAPVVIKNAPIFGIIGVDGDPCSYQETPPFFKDAIRKKEKMEYGKSYSIIYPYLGGVKSTFIYLGEYPTDNTAFNAGEKYSNGEKYIEKHYFSDYGIEPQEKTNLWHSYNYTVKK